MASELRNKIIRVFPRATAATPGDDMAFVGDPPLFLPPADQVHVSCTFTWDRAEAERLAKAWAKQYPKVRLGGPAYDDRGGEFAPGMYLKAGRIITTRGCPNKCWFCLVPRREGPLRELQIKPGWDVLDNNLLAASRRHIDAVLEMLVEQQHPAKFTGGLEASRISGWFVQQLAQIRLQILYLAYDRVEQALGVRSAIGLLREAGLNQRQVGCYVLVGWPSDSMQRAEARLQWAFGAGATPFAMFYRPPNDLRFTIPPAWRAFVRKWSRPAAIFATQQAGTEARDGRCGQ